MAASINDTTEAIADSEHRRSFNLAAFGRTFEAGENPVKQTKQRRKILSKEQYELYMHRLRYWDVVEGYTDPETRVHITQAGLKKSCESSWRRSRLQYRIQLLTLPFEGRPVEHMQIFDGTHDAWKVVVHEEMVFDVIQSCHVAVGHKKVAATKKIAELTYYSLTEDLCRIYIDRCPLCIAVSQGVGVATNIVAKSRFRERFTACTVNYSRRPIEDVNGVKLKFILVIQDEATKFTMLRPVGCVDPRVLENELRLMFMTIGYPKKVFLCEEGSNLASVLIAKMIEREEPNCVQEYGLVDEICDRVKNVIAELEEKEREKQGEDEEERRWMENREVSWVSVVPMAVKIINETAYPKVFGTQFSSSDLSRGGAVARASGETERGGTAKKRRVDDLSEDLSEAETNNSRSKNTESSEKKVLYPQLLCQECDRLTANGRRLVTLMEDETYYDSFAVGNQCWTTDMIRTFGILKSHEAHRDDMIFVDSGTPTTRDNRLPGDVRSLELPDTVTSILTVAWKNNHFVAIQIRLDHSTTVVYEGRKTDGCDLNQWVEHEEYILSRYGINKENSNMKWHIRYHKETLDFRRTMRLRQDDNHSCGPIACRVLWELLAPGEADEKYSGTQEREGGRARRPVTSDNVSNWRSMCINELKAMLCKHAAELKFPVNNRGK